MYCSKCGKEVADNMNFCSACGAKILHPITPDGEVKADETKINSETLAENTDEARNCGTVPYYSNAVPAEQVPVELAPVGQAPVVKKSGKKTALIVVASVVAFAVVLTVIISGLVRVVGTNNLKKELLRDWSRTESSDGSFYTLELDFSEEQIDYNFSSSFAFLDSTLATYDYEVVSPNKIVVDYGISEVEIKVEFDDEKEMMIFTPALTSTDSSEYWYNFDY